jgi:hypothetical protein
MMEQDKLTITTLGYKAEQVIQEEETLQVVGQANRGIYLQPQDDLTLFLSMELYKGPLTLNCSGELSLIKLLEPGISAEISNSNIFFPDLDLHISTKEALTWKIPHLPANIKPSTGNLDTFTKKLKDLAGKDPVYPLVDWIINGPNPKQSRFSGASGKLLEILIEDKGQQVTYLHKKLIGFLGIGPGLTPLGDDFVLGVLLVLNRGYKSILDNDELREINQQVIQYAWGKTTRISASLLVCAAEGAADERLIRVLDGLLKNDPIPDQDLADLLKWGSSSGIAVLAGMLYILFKDNRGNGFL